jgi:hypothetical protein
VSPQLTCFFFSVAIPPTNNPLSQFNVVVSTCAASGLIHNLVGYDFFTSIIVDEGERAAVDARKKLLTTLLMFKYSCSMFGE